MPSSSGSLDALAKSEGSDKTNMLANRFKKNGISPYFQPR